nr:MAG TPA: hypothetical protein [Caudoviricetes sp.]
MALTATAFTIGSFAVSWGAAIAATLAVAATAISVTTGVIQGNQQKAMANYQRQVNEQNAQASRQAAQAKIANQRRAAKFTYGSQLARLGGMGALAEGSPLDIMGQSAGQEKYDEMVTDYEGEVQAVNFQQKAALNKYQADVASYNIGLNATTSVVKGMASVGNSLLGGVTSLGAGKTGDFATSTGSSIDIGKDYLTGNMIA